MFLDHFGAPQRGRTWSDLDHFLSSSRVMDRVSRSLVLRKWDLSDHFPVVTQLKFVPLRGPEEHFSKVCLNRSGFDDKLQIIAHDNHFTCLEVEEITSQEQLDSFNDKFIATIHEVAVDLGLSKQQKRGTVPKTHFLSKSMTVLID
ncbi:hypothetical protein CROQUDRAFT_101774 [Cronartium quercuum f. sp. fusiforme G11]|uniref:Uncharacterized protein n=1 Tax=Cronartium quercuum f. sp. fusiforme G11 TaxID=708437 RepID=A0A9P6N549_9BASI|nr:hypothetical protein CROQUDRAFT_101774 [Cronartium quercuum f. sp. fusiforme G11]